MKFSEFTNDMFSKWIKTRKSKLDTRPLYSLDIKDDITAHELALLVSMLIRVIFGQRKFYMDEKATPPGVQRHFKRVEK